MLPYAQVSRLAGRPYGGLNLPKQPGLDGRHRDVNGQIHQKRGDTRTARFARSMASTLLAGLGRICDWTPTELKRGRRASTRFAANSAKLSTRKRVWAVPYFARVVPNQRPLIKTGDAPLHRREFHRDGAIDARHESDDTTISRNGEWSLLARRAAMLWSPSSAQTLARRRPRGRPCRQSSARFLRPRSRRRRRPAPQAPSGGGAAAN